MRPRLALLSILFVLAHGAAPVAAAAEVDFEPVRATFTYGESIDFEQVVTLPVGVTRIQAVVRAGPNAPTALSVIPTPPAGRVTLRYSRDTPFGSIYPNTVVEVGFRVSFAQSYVDGPTTTIRYEDTRFDWKTVEGDVVRVHWYEGGGALGRRALDIGERAVDEASTLLGVTEEDPIDFFIYADGAPFRDAIGPGLQENVGGIAVSEIRTLFAHIAPGAVDDPWVGVIVPHELTHVVFGTATANPYHSPVHWLNEGLADYLAQGNTASARANVARAERAGELMPLEALVGQFPTPPDLFSLAYDEAVSAIDFMVRTYGQDALVKLVRSYSDGVSDDAAFTAALGVDTAAFEAAWLADLGLEAPKPYGPRPAPPGPVPPGWAAGPVQTAAPGASGQPSTPGPSDPDGGDVAGSIVLGVVLALGILLVLALVVTARRFNRGEPL